MNGCECTTMKPNLAEDGDKYLNFTPIKNGGNSKFFSISWVESWGGKNRLTLPHCHDY